MKKQKVVLSSFIKSVSTVNGVTRTVAREYCTKFFAAVKSQLVEEQEVRVPNVLILRVRHKKARNAHNPSSGQMEVIAARNTATIRISPNLINDTSIFTGLSSKFFSYLLGKGVPLDVTKTIIDELASAIRNQVQVEVRGFGSIHYTYLPERTVRNPKTGENVIAPPLNKTLFRLSPEFLKMLNVGNPAIDK